MDLAGKEDGASEYSTEYDDFVDFLAEAEDLDSSSVKTLRSGDRSSMYQSARQVDIGDEKLCRLMADYLDLEYYPVIDPESILTDRFPVPFSRSNLVLAVSDSDDSVTYVLSNPFDLQLMDTVDMVSSCEDPTIAIAQPESILALLKKRPSEDRTVEVITSRHDEESAEEEEEHSADAAGSQLKGILEIDHEPTKDDINRSPIKYIADRIMFTAAKEDASDIHIEPKADKTIVRYRIHGDMMDKFTLKNRTGRILLSRFKVLADMDIAERRKPQDGSLEAFITGKRYKMRLATTSTQHGESIVIRLLDADSEPMDLSQLGMTPEQAEIMYDLSQQHSGAIIVVGTTGSGKSTTLYSLISRIDVQNKSLMTIEDPVEYEIKYANQQEVNEKAGVTFEALLRSAVRQDPRYSLPWRDKRSFHRQNGHGSCQHGTPDLRNHALVQHHHIHRQAQEAGCKPWRYTGFRSSHRISAAHQEALSRMQDGSLNKAGREGDDRSFHGGYPR